MKHTSLKYLEIDFIIFDPFHYDIQLNRNSKSKISNSLLFVWYVLRYIQPYKIQTIKYKHWSDLADVHQLVFLTSPPNNCQSAKIELVMWNKQIATAEKRNGIKHVTAVPPCLPPRSGFTFTSGYFSIMGTSEFLFKISCRLPPSLVAEEEAVGGLQEEVGVAGEGEANMQNSQNMIGRSSWGGGRKYAKYAK